MNFRKNAVLFSLLFSSTTYGFYSSEEIIKEFQNKKMGVSTLDSVMRAPAATAQFFMPKLDEVIPKDLQEKLDQKKAKAFGMNFSGVQNEVDLRHRDSEVVKQIGPRCSAYGLAAAMENLLGHPNYATVSRNHLWSLYGVYSSDAAVNAAKHNPLTEEVMWPHNQKHGSTGWKDKAHTQLTHITYIDNNVEKAVRALDAGRPVYLGASVTKSWGACDVVMDPNSLDNGNGHAVAIVGYKLDQSVPGGGYFIIKNSWGPDCGDQGYQYFAFNYCTRGNGSYCVMWDVQGITTGFAGVNDVQPKYEIFNVNKMNIEVSASKKWYQIKRRVSVNISGESVHAQQVKSVSFLVDNGMTSTKDMDIDEASFTFKTKSSRHDILVQMELDNGQMVEKTVHWSR